MSLISAAVETEDVTIVVATRNRPDQLARTMGHHRAPVIVVDNGSDQPIRLPGVHVVRLEANIGAAARNIGAERARTRYIAFADDDSYWTPGSLARAAALLDAHPRTALLAAEVRVGPEGHPDPVCAQMAAAPFGTPPDAAGPTVLGFLACAVVLRRSSFLAAGGFQPELFIYGEEELLAMDLAAAGWLLSYTPSLTVRHLPEPAGRSPRARRRLEARNRVITAVLRRPPAVVARLLLETAATEPAAVADVVRRLPWALRHRRTLPAPVEAVLRRRT